MTTKKRYTHQELKQLHNDTKRSNGGTIGDHKRFIFSVTDQRISPKADFNTFFGLFQKLRKTAETLNLNGYCFGFWHDRGMICFDLNLSSNDVLEAMTLASFFKQKAIYDSESDTVLNVVPLTNTPKGGVLVGVQE